MNRVLIIDDDKELCTLMKKCVEHEHMTAIIAHGGIEGLRLTEVTLNDSTVELTGKEFDLLSFLASNKGRVFTKKQIYTQVWYNEYAFDDSNIMSFISKLRKKIEPDPEQPFYIQTVRGVGYRFNKEA